MKSVHICDGCGEEFLGSGSFCHDCGCVKIRNTKQVLKFGKDSYDPKRDRSRDYIKSIRRQVTVAKEGY